MCVDETQVRKDKKNNTQQTKEKSFHLFFIHFPSNENVNFLVVVELLFKEWNEERKIKLHQEQNLCIRWQTNKFSLQFSSPLSASTTYFYFF